MPCLPAWPTSQSSSVREDFLTVADHMIPPASPLQLHNPHHFTHEKTNMKDHVPSEGKLGREAKLCFPGQCSFHSLGLATETSTGGPGCRPSAQDVYTVMLSGVS